MRNDAIAPNGSDALPPPWVEAMALLDQDLRRRGAAEGTRGLYRSDVEELARWAVPYDLAPAEIDYPWLRRYAAQLAERGLAPRTVSRKLAGLRACFRVLVEHGRMEANPAELLSSPKLPQRLPRALKPADVSRLLDRDPGLDAARAARPRHVRARLRLRAARGGARRPRRRLGRLRRRAGAGRGQGRQDALRARRRARAARRWGAIWSAPGARWTRARGSPRCSCPRPAGGSPRRTSGAACGPGRGTPRRRARCTRTPSVIRSRLIFWREVPIYGPSRPCSDTPPYPQPRSTLG